MRLKALPISMLAAAFCAVFICEPAQGQPEQRGDEPIGADARQVCPMAVEGAEVSVRDTVDGVALEFTTEDGDVEDLRRRVRWMAAMYEMRHMHREMHWRHMGRGGRGMGQGRGQGMGPGAGPMPAARAEVQEIEGGARLVFTPEDPGQLDALRQRVRAHQQRMRSGQCWMMQQRGVEEPPAR